MKVLTIFIFVIAIFAIFPFALIWSINELLEQAGSTTQITYNFWSWLSALVISCFFNSNSSNK